MVWFDLDTNEEIHDSDDSDFEECGRENQAKLKSLRENVQFEVTGERLELLRQIHSLIGDWKGPFPDFRDIFRPEEIDLLLSDDFEFGNRQKFIRFVARSGYKDTEVREPSSSSSSSSRRTTAVHRFSRLTWTNEMMPELFQIYDRFDVNYVDEVGSSHLHVASMFGCDDIVEKFLKHGQDPNCVEREKGETPLHLAVRLKCHDAAELLLLHGADPSLANFDGMTPLHMICSRKGDACLAKMCGLTTLYWALKKDYNEVVELLLRRGANPNLANNEGVTPLHIICDDPFKEHDESLAELFKICDELKRLVEVDARDNTGRTPLQLAVKNLRPKAVDILLKRGAVLTSFVFLFSKYFEAGCELENYDKKFKLGLASRALAIVELLEKKGYTLDRCDVMITMAFFDRHDLLQKSADLDEFWYEDEEFAKEARKITLKDKNRTLSLYDSFRLRPKEAAKLLTNEACLDFLDRLYDLPRRYQEACLQQLFEKLSRRFFRRWTLDCFLELTSYRLPILCCEAILENLMNQDLYRIFLAATSQSHEDGKEIATKHEIKCISKRPVRAKKVPKKLQDYVC